MAPDLGFPADFHMVNESIALSFASSKSSDHQCFREVIRCDNRNCIVSGGRQSANYFFVIIHQSSPGIQACNLEMAKMIRRSKQD